MPCRTDINEADEAFAELNKVTAMLCAVMKVMQGNEHLVDHIPGLMPWWTRHKKVDEARRARQVKENKDKIAALEKEIDRLKGEA